MWILEEPIHFFDLARWYLLGTGRLESVFARANSRQADHPKLQDNFSAIVQFSGGAYQPVEERVIDDCSLIQQPPRSWLTYCVSLPRRLDVPISRPPSGAQRESGETESTR